MKDIVKNAKFPGLIEKTGIIVKAIGNGQGDGCDKGTSDCIATETV